MTLAHQIRLNPTCKQEAYFRRACGTARFTYNYALQAWKEAYELGEKPSGRSLRAKFNSIREAEFPWSFEVHRDCTARPFDNLQRAFTSFFRRLKEGKKPGYPRFKKRGIRDSFYVANDKLTLNRRTVKLPLIGTIKMREALRFQGKVLGATVKRIADGWFLSVQVDVGDYQKDRIAEGIVGVDLGLKSSVTLSDGTVIQGPKPLRSALRKLKRESRWHSRKVKGSNNRRKASLKLARVHRRVSWIRNDFLHKLTSKLCRENQAIGIEDLAVGNLSRNHHLALGILDEGWAEFRRQLEYKSLIYGAYIQVFPRFYPSSKTCSNCGLVKDSLPLSERVFRCGGCGFTCDRDVNASLNLVPTVSREFTPVDKEALAKSPLDSVKLLWMKQELTGTYLCVPER